MTIGVVCSAGGASFFEAYDQARNVGLLKANDVFVITDRACGAEYAADKRGIPRQRLTERTNEGFSAAAAEHFTRAGCELNLLIFSRLVTNQIYERFPTLNVHPAILPAFPGIGALDAAFEAKVRLIGATLHVVDKTIDGGAIVSQVASPLGAGTERKVFDRISFIQKSYLLLVALDLHFSQALHIISAPRSAATLDQNLRVTKSASPALQEQALIDSFQRFQRSIEFEALEP